MDDLCNIIGCSFDIYYGGVVIITQTGCPLDDHFPINLITGQTPVISVNAICRFHMYFCFKSIVIYIYFIPPFLSCAVPEIPCTVCSVKTISIEKEQYMV